MASYIVRSAMNISRRGLFTSAVRSAIPEEFPETMSVLTGLEKKEIEANIAGKDDPFHMNAVRRGVGTKDKPTLVASAFESRLLGCICHDEHSSSVCYMWLHRGAPQRCGCGHYFQLVYEPPFEAGRPPCE